MAQTATTGNLENAQRTIIAAARYTEEHNAPAMALIEKFTLGKGEKTVTVPKVGQMTMDDLTDGVDIVDEESIGMTTVDLTASEVGAKVILTDKLVRQSSPNVMAIIGRQLGSLGAAGGGEITQGFSADLLRNFYSGLRPINNVPIFEDGNIAKESSVDSGIGVIADKSALAVLVSVDTRTERQRDASLRATEVVMTADYGVFELDDTRGAGVQFEIGDLSTS